MTLTKRQMKLAAVFLFIALFGLYGYFKSSAILSGPGIIISEPVDGATVSNSFITVAGQAKRISRLYLNDNQIFTDNRGYFAESLLLLPGYNILKLRAEDNFGREETRFIELVVNN